MAQCWRLGTSSRPFYDFIKITIQQDLAIFNSWYLSFLIVPYSPFQKNETMESWHKWLLSNWSRLLKWKGPVTYPSPSNVQKNAENFWPCLFLSIAQGWCLNELWFKRYIEKCTLSHVLILIMTSRFDKLWDG